MKQILPGLLLYLLLPSTVSAAIVINEIAWMGGINSANDEWIELYNTGDSEVRVDGWTVEDGVSLRIPLEGSIGSGKYAVLERTDDASAPGSAFLIYTGALSNERGTLILRDASGAIQDSVEGGEKWEVLGGDNVTKDTPQRTSNGWITAHPTPGRANATVAIMRSQQTENSSDSTQSTKKSAYSGEKVKKQTIELSAPESVLTISLNVPEVAYAGGEVTFGASGRGISPELVDSIQYEWNFGDTHIGSGKKVTHVYDYPGKYFVVALGKFGSYEAEVNATIEIRSPMLMFKRTLSGDILLTNEGPEPIDLSGYVLEGIRTFVFPQRTILLSESTLFIPKDRVMSGSYSPVRLVSNGLVPVTFLSPAGEYTSTNSLQTETGSPLQLVHQAPFTETPRPNPRSEKIAEITQVNDVDTHADAFSLSSGEETYIRIGRPAPDQDLESTPLVKNPRLPYLWIIVVIALVGYQLTRLRRERVVE